MHKLVLRDMVMEQTRQHGLEIIIPVLVGLQGLIIIEATIPITLIVIPI